MPTHVDYAQMVAMGVEEIRRGNLFIMSEPHSGDRTCVDIAKEIMSKAPGKSAKLMLEAPIQMHSGTRKQLEDFLTTTHTPSLNELPSHALKTGWGLHCVDGDFRKGSVDIRQSENVGKYSQDRQLFIAGNIKKFAKATQGGCLILYGRMHIQGKGKSRMTPDGIRSFAKCLSNTGYSKREAFLLQKAKIYAQPLGRAELT